MKTISKKIKELLEIKGKTKEELALFMSFSPNIDEILDGKKQPTRCELKWITRFLDIPMSSFARDVLPKPTIMVDEIINDEINDFAYSLYHNPEMSDEQIEQFLKTAKIMENLKD